MNENENKPWLVGAGWLLTEKQTQEAFWVPAGLCGWNPLFEIIKTYRIGGSFSGCTEPPLLQQVIQETHITHPFDIPPQVCAFSVVFTSRFVEQISIASCIPVRVFTSKLKKCKFARKDT